MTEFMKPSDLWVGLVASVREMSAARMWANGVVALGSCGVFGAGTDAFEVGDTPWVRVFRAGRIAVFHLN